MSLEELYDNHEICKLEEKLLVKPLEPKDFDGREIKTYIGKYPLEPVKYRSKGNYEFVGDGNGGTYGGELIAQAVQAGWESLKEPAVMSPHSLHTYFAKPGSHESAIRWEVQVISEGKTFASRIVQGFQLHNNVLVTVIQISFVKHNSIAHRLSNNKRVLQLQKKPLEWFYKYKDILDDMNYFAHLHEFVENIVPPEFFQPTFGVDFNTNGNSELGYFVRFSDDNEKAVDLKRARYLQLTYLSDNFFLGTILKALGLPILGTKFDHLAFFRVSLDHSVYFHDDDFDPLDWLYVDYRFSNFTNDRTLAQCFIYTLSGKLVASVVQEGLIYLKDHFHDAIQENATISSEPTSVQPKL